MWTKNRTFSGTGPYPHSILSYCLQRHHALADQSRHGIDQQLPQELDMQAAKVAECVIVDTDAAAVPSVTGVSFTNPVQLPS